MNIKSLVTTSVIAIATASAAQAADVIIPRETAPAVITAAPAYSWTGFYIGGQVGNFSSKVDIYDSESKKKISDKDWTAKPSGFMGGIYVGSNVDLGNGIILGVETDAVWADREESKSSSTVIGTDGLADFKDELTAAKATYASGKKIDDIKTDDKRVEGFSLKEKWSGATRVRVGFAAVDRIMPYVAGGIAYTQLQWVDFLKAETAGGTEVASAKLSDHSKTFVGFTIGGGVDFAMTDNVLLRAEYRYSDYGKKAFKKDGDKVAYRTNDFRVGVAYKF
ncbi:porin family protein [Bartonella krasnovii]|uniref:Porin family protein n=1 Tax=Bartonella krasnovii TaxID=2267275 RepID=A0A5B9D0M3_9HYPH|nr:outer membrane protein [Bartonella krasnovii]QEE11584.1 porin family protein [Bartonella krasnovii]UNF44058.1 porin family protein [Bartonella krasnovii]UNF53911.1 porin family protein [Bartonella krasnovii]